MLKKIVCIEDDRITRNTQKRPVGNEVFSGDKIAVCNGRQTINYYRNLLNIGESISDYPDLILLDLNEKDMRGWRFLNEFENLFKNQYSMPNVLVVTSLIHTDESEKSDQEKTAFSQDLKSLFTELSDDLNRRLN